MRLEDQRPGDLYLRQQLEQRRAEAARREVVGPVAVALQYEPGQTALDADELAQLIPRHITTQGPLNEWEQANIVEALKWLKRGRHPAVLTEKFCRELHKRMSAVFPQDEIAMRFHHQLVLVQAFPNGNGRHSRLMTDSLLAQMGGPPFSWGEGVDLVGGGDVRDLYLDALRAADAGSITKLTEFVRR